MGTWTGLVGGVSKAPWDSVHWLCFRSQFPPMSDMSLSQMGDFQVFSAPEPYVQFKPKLVKTELLHRYGEGSNVTNMRALPQSQGDLPAQRNPEAV